MEPSKRNPLKKFELSEFRGARARGNRRGGKQEFPAGSESETGSVASSSGKTTRPFTLQEKDELTLPFHAACRSKNSPGRAIEALLTKEGSSRFSVEDLSGNHDTALHIACANNNSEAVQALLKHSKHKAILNCLHNQNKDGNTPFHLACMACSTDICASLLQLESGGSPRSILVKKNKLGQTCLGIAAENKDWGTAHLLLEHSHDNPILMYDDFKRLAPGCSSVASLKLEALNNDPIDVFVLGDQGSGKTTLINTLMQAMQPSSLVNLITSFGFSRANMETSTIGIVPTIVEFHRQLSLDQKCPIAFHDVNSYHGYSHEAIFKCCTRDPFDALYIVSVDMTKNVQRSTLYWLHFLCRKLTEFGIALTTEKKSRKLRFVVAGTFAYNLLSSYPIQLDINNIITKEKDADMLTSSLTCFGSFCINAKKTSSCGPILSAIHACSDHLQSNCVSDEAKRLLAQTYILAYLLSSYPKNEAVSFRQIQGLINNSTSNVLCSLLPKNRERIDLICNNLRCFSQFKIIRITRRKVHEFVVLDYPYLMKSVEKGLMNLKHCSRHGIVSRQDIKESVDYYPQHFVLYFLEEYNLSEKISKNGLDDMRTSIRTSSRSMRTLNLSQSPGTLRPLLPSHKRSRSESETLAVFSASTLDRKSSSKNDILTVSNAEPKRAISLSTDHELSPDATPQSQPVVSSRQSSRAKPHKREVPYYFLPSLIPRKKPSEVWDGDSDEYGYGFAWCLVPREGDTWFLSHKFSTVVLFRLLFSYAPQPSAKSDFSLERVCELWDEGILWCDPQGARICVSICDRNKIILSMQCLKGLEIACLSIRNEIMKDIKEQLHEIHPSICPREIFLPYDGNQDIFPVFDMEMSYTAFDKEDIKKAIFGECTVVSTNGKQNRHVKSLLYFEPLCFLKLDLLHKLFDGENTSKEISEDFWMTLAKSLSCNWVHLAKHWEAILQKYYIDSLLKNSIGSPHDTAFEMLLHLKDIDYVEPNYRIDTYSGLQKSLFEISIFPPECIINTIS